MRVTVRAQWDMGHRLPNHGGRCRNLHGHRYVAELTLRGPVHSDPGESDEGMVADFGPVKDVLNEIIRQDFDHRFLVCDRDPLKGQLHHLPGVLVVDYVPTAENIAAQLLAMLQDDGALGEQVVALRLYETPDSWADAGEVA